MLAIFDDFLQFPRKLRARICGKIIVPVSRLCDPFSVALSSAAVSSRGMSTIDSRIDKSGQSVRRARFIV